VHSDLNQPDSGNNPRPNARRVREHPYPRSARPHGGSGRATQTDPNCELTMPDEDAYMPRLMGYVSFEFNYSFYDIIRRGYTRTASAGMLMPVDIEFSLPELRDGITAAKRARCTRRWRR